MNRRITCVICPRGCTMTADIRDGQITVTGHTCPKGEKHAIAECTNPVRSLTSSIRVTNREDTMVSVKSADPVPKGEIFAIMERIRSAAAPAPIAIGDVLIDDICGTRIIATKEIP